MRIKYIPNLFVVVILSCCYSNYQESLFIDNDLSTSSSNQMIPSSVRGEVGVHYFSSDSTRDARRFLREMYSPKLWIISNWGKPDYIEKTNDIEYLIYFSNDSKMNQPQISPYGKKYVKIGYKNGNMVYIEAIVANSMEHGGKSRVILKK